MKLYKVTLIIFTRITSGSEATCERDNNTLLSFNCEIKKNGGDNIELMAQQLKSDSILIFLKTPKTRLYKIQLNVVDLKAKELRIDLNKDFILSMRRFTGNIRSELNYVNSHRI